MLKIINELSGSRYSAWLVHLIGLSVLVTVFVVFQSCYISAWKTQTRINESRIDQLKGIIKNGGGLRIECAHLEKQIQQQKKLARSINHPNLNSNGPEFSLKLTEIINAAGLTVNEFRDEANFQFELFSKQTIQLDGTGTYSQICKFIELLEDMDRVIRIERLAVDAVDNGSPYKIDLSVSLYFDFKHIPDVLESVESNVSDDITMVSVEAE